MYDVYKILAYCFICVVILTITILCVNSFAEKKCRDWKIDCIGIICVISYVIVKRIMDVPISVASGCFLVSVVIILCTAKEARKDDDADT